MAKRKPIVIDGQVVAVPTYATLDQVVAPSVRSITTQEGALVPRERFAQTPIPDGFETNLSETNKGAPGLRELLIWEARNVQAWLNSFEPPRRGRRQARLHPSGQLLNVDALPLPDHYPLDQADVMLVIDQFPSRPPIGLYVLNRHQKVIEQLRAHFNTFADRAFHEAPSIAGYTWVCYHYRDNRWNYNANNPAAHDNLRKFLNTFFAEA